MNDITALVRDPSRMPISHPRLHMIQGDARNLKDVAAVVEGQEAACDCLGIRSFFTETKLFSTCAQNLVQALKRKQLLIAVIGMGAGDSRGCGPFFYDHVMLPLLLGRVYVDKDRQERIIMDNTARWVIVRPGFLRVASPEMV